MQIFEVAQIQQQRQAQGGPWLEFLREPSLSLGIYALAAGSIDRQEPHTEDEVYYVLEGVAMINVAGEDRPVQAGSVIFVGANVPHHFHTIEQALSVLVFFAPAEYSNAATEQPA
jgi:mannose-6-phosphate isomerase-like protein (cupin superfamily)